MSTPGAPLKFTANWEPGFRNTSYEVPNGSATCAGTLSLRHRGSGIAPL